MPSFIPDATLKAALADTLIKADQSNLVAAYDTIVSRANMRAYADIVGILTARGYSVDQVAAWDQAATMQTFQGLYWCFVLGASTHGEDDKWADKFDCREQMKGADFNIAVNGIPVAPALPASTMEIQSGQTAVGALINLERNCERSHYWPADFGNRPYGF